MPIANNHQVDKEKLSATSLKILELKEIVLAERERRVRLPFQEAQELRHTVFINTIPAYYDNIVELLTPGYERDDAISNATLASEHGSAPFDGNVRRRHASNGKPLWMVKFAIFNDGSGDTGL
jgi:hypothetical protein